MNPSSDDFRDDALDQAIALRSAGLPSKGAGQDEASTVRPSETPIIVPSSSQEIVLLSQSPAEHATRSAGKDSRVVKKRSVADALKASLEAKSVKPSAIKRERTRSPTIKSPRASSAPARSPERAVPQVSNRGDGPPHKRVKGDDQPAEKGLGNMLFEWTPEQATAQPDARHTLHASGVFSGSSRALATEGWIKPDEDWMPPGMGGVKQTRIGRVGGDADGRGGYKAPEGKAAEFKNDAEINRHLLKTLGQESNPITNSDLYSRTAHIISASTGHQVSQRGASKFCMPERTYMQRRNEKLKEQFTARVPDPAPRESVEAVQLREESKQPRGYWAQGGPIPPPDDAEGKLGQGEAFEPWIVGGIRPKRVGVGDLQSRIFAGCTIYINGYTGPRISDLELKRLIALHGGNVSYHCTSACTHILVVKGLSATKSQKFLDSSSSTRAGKRKVVHVDWALDSVAQGKKLSETTYNVIVNKSQPTLMSTLQAKED